MSAVFVSVFVVPLVFNLQLFSFNLFPSGSPSLFFCLFSPSRSPSGKLTKTTFFSMCESRGFCQLFPFFRRWLRRCFRLFFCSFSPSGSPSLFFRSFSPSGSPSETRNNILGKSILKLIFFKKKPHRTPQDVRSQATPYNHTPHICPIIYIYFPYLKKKRKKE